MPPARANKEIAMNKRIEKMETAREVREYLEGMNLSQCAVEALVRDTAPCRARWRCDQVQWTVREHVASLCSSDSPDRAYYRDGLPLAICILLADIIGVGGRDDCEGLSSDRHPGLTGLGKGRKQATDGPAWSEAVREAVREMTLEVSRKTGAVCLCFIPTQDRVSLSCLSDDGDDHHLAWADSVVHPRWMRSIIREGLRVSAGIPSRSNVPVRWFDSIHGWANCLTAIEAQPAASV
jgi:hypothetical protein